ncbi:glycosyltransferase [Pseudomonas sp. StFLB209]|nr:glycosyltransferase [Pseudomonas sp. StFLB209]
MELAVCTHACTGITVGQQSSYNYRVGYATIGGGNLSAFSDQECCHGLRVAGGGRGYVRGGAVARTRSPAGDAQPAP